MTLLPLSRTVGALALAALLVPTSTLAAPDDGAQKAAATHRGAQVGGGTAPTSDAPASTSGGFLGALDELFAPTGVIGDLGHLFGAPQGGDLAILGGGLGLSVTSMRAGGDSWTRNGGEPRLGAVGDGMTFIGRRTSLYPALIGTFAVGKLLRDPGVSGTAAELTQAVMLTDLIVAPLKGVVGRARPDGSGHGSYPSGHAAAAFAMATVLQRRYGTRAGLPAYAFAVVMGAARIDQDRHFLSDVVAGAAIGVVAARAVGRRFAGHAIVLHPVVGDAGGSGLGVTVRF